MTRSPSIQGRPRIVILDGHTLNPGDLDWTPIAELGDLTVHDRTPERDIAARAAGAAIVLTNKAPLTGDVAALTTQTIASAFRIGVQLAAPFLVFGLLFNFGLGVLSRLMPQMQVFFVGLPLSILVGFVVLILVVGTMMTVYLGYLEGVLMQLAPAR